MFISWQKDWVIFLAWGRPCRLILSMWFACEKYYVYVCGWSSEKHHWVVSNMCTFLMKTYCAVLLALRKKMFLFVDINKFHNNFEHDHFWFDDRLQWLKSWWFCIFPSQIINGHAPNSVVVRKGYPAAFALALQIVLKKAIAVQITTACVKVKTFFKYSQAFDFSIYSSQRSPTEPLQPPSPTPPPPCSTLYAKDFAI